MSNLYLQHHGIKGMKWGVRRYQNSDGSLTAAGKARVKKQESKIKARSKKMADSGHKYLGQKHEYRDLKKLYDKYGINKDFEDKHTVNLSYTRGKTTFEAKMIKYKDVIVKDKGGRTVEMLSNGKKEVFTVDDGEFIALRIADLYGDKAMNEFYDSYKKKDLTSRFESAKKDLTSRFESAKKDNPKLSYDTIYKEMKIDTGSDDPDVYKKAEDEWLKKHGY